MTKKRVFLGTALVVLMLLISVWAGFFPPISVYGASGEQKAACAYYDDESTRGAYDYDIDRYEIDFVLGKDRRAKVVEKITARFLGYANHGIIRDLPLGGDLKYYNLSATCDNEDFSAWIESDDVGYISYYLGGNRVIPKYDTRTYTISYELQLPAESRSGLVRVSLVGYGWQCEIRDVTLRVTFPDGLKEDGYKIYSGEYSNVENDEYTDGGTLIGNSLVIHCAALPYSYNYHSGYKESGGISLDLYFNDGVLTNRVDTTLFVTLGIGAALLAIGFLLKMLLFRQPLLTRTVNLDAPEEMDPLLMGKLIDDTVDSEDMGALVFWLADKGYLKIDMSEDEKNPLLVKTEKPMEESMPAHCRIIYDGLFDGRDSVKVSSLGNSFYKTADAAKTSVNAAVQHPFKKSSYAAAVVLCLLTVLSFGFVAWLYPLMTVHDDYHYIGGFIFGLLAFALGGVGSFIAARRKFKWKLWVRVLTAAGGVVLGLLIGALTFAFPNPTLSRLSMFLFCAFATGLGLLSGFFLCRTKEYNEKLGHILGFKMFIETTERDRVEFMLKDDPELFYHVLPYAQVLGVTDAWTEKFEGLNMAQPSYVTGGSVFTDYLIWRTMFRGMTISMARNMVSRPSSHGGGGFGGGFGGGGFGGGGGRGF